MFEYFEAPRKNRIHLCKTEIETPKNIFTAEYMINRRSIHAFVSSFNAFMKCVVNQFFYVFVSSNSVDKIASKSMNIFQ